MSTSLPSNDANWLVNTLAELANQLDQARLPLHILLENRFGDLNENQEEMLGAAQSAIKEADVRLRRLREMLDQGALVLRQDIIPTQPVPKNKSDTR